MIMFFMVMHEAALLLATTATTPTTAKPTTNVRPPPPTHPLPRRQFKYVQSFLVLYMVVASFGAAAFCLHDPLAHYWPRAVAVAQNTRLCSAGPIARLLASRTAAASLSTALAGVLVVLWLLTSHWIVLDILGVCMVIMGVSFVRLPSLKVGHSSPCSSTSLLFV